MPGAPRKSAATKVQPKAVEPVVDEVDEDVFDLLSVLDTEDLPPVPVTLRGVKAQIRRSYSGAESVLFTEYLRQEKVEELLTLIAGDEGGPALSKALAAFNTEQGVKLFNWLAKTSTLTSGEAMALLPAYARGMDGAQPTQDANASTAEPSVKS
ncbi:hypothetical protein QM716_10370 [Rhodococcus sp. IEGM 1409]|uniref:hypothetical protein n=1 Tax=Rhodococcus sp. IEGM 1409 TaxID=3047082 RepID=UPI0024B76F08|nr:hypothetical protein [Rhodococcus sp. IEGM 1409]MDI9900259.1 hypothetical protein [Rhodococcus sp. IEGM 1409]